MTSRYENPSRRTLARLALACLAVMAHATWFDPAFAHSKMKHSVPEDGATVSAGLEQIELRFSDGLRLMLVKVSQIGVTTAKDIMPAPLPKEFTRHAVMPIDPLEPGDYQVTWTGVGKDGHAMNGTFKFTVASD